MLNFKYISLNEEVLTNTLKLTVSGQTLYLFPTRKSLNEALRLFLKNWDLSQHKFLTMEDWKGSFLQTDKPVLKEEKRTLALYQSLTSEAKDFFKIDNYHKSIEFSYNFFSFWEEIDEEKITEDAIYEVLDGKFTAENWQQECYVQLVKIKQNYSDLLDKHSFTDKIFSLSEPDFQQEAYSRIIVVNQFYFTRLEKELLLSYPGDVTIVTQLPAACLNESEISVSSDFAADMIKPFVRNKINVFTSQDQYEMIYQLSTQLPVKEPATIIDFRFDQQPYAHLLDPSLFTVEQQYPFTATRIFRFWKSIKEMLDSTLWEGSPFLLSIASLLNLTCSDDLLVYFTQDKDLRSDIKAYLFRQIDADVHYLDLDIFRPDEKEIEQVFVRIFNFLDSLFKIKNMKEFKDLIISDPNLNYLLGDSPKGSELCKVFLEAVSDFFSIEKIGFIDWKIIFPDNKISNLLQLFLNYLKAKEVVIPCNDKPYYTITTLQNSRNLSYDNLYILNVIEGILPDRKHTQFLFSENQRKKLGLKSYDDITLRDKFYFYRLLTSSRKVNVFTIADPEENVEISSFLEELHLAGLIEFQKEPVPENLRSEIFKQLLQAEVSSIPSPEEITSRFFSFPCQPSEHWGDQLILSFYKWEKMSKNPFEFYLEYVKGLKRRVPDVSTDLSPKAIGNIGHEIMNLVWERIISVYHSKTFNYDFIFNIPQYVNDAVQRYFKYDRKFKYISPHNYSQSYFRNIFLPILIEGLSNFFYYLQDDLELGGKKITVFPETGTSYQKELFQLEGTKISLKGRPDLRIETEAGRYIFDYKTGSNDRNKATRFDPQLQFYELLCYDYDSLEKPADIISCLYFIEQKDLKRISKRINLEEEIIKTLISLQEKGFTLAEKSCCL